MIDNRVTDSDPFAKLISSPYRGITVQWSREYDSDPLGCYHVDINRGGAQFYAHVRCDAPGEELSLSMPNRRTRPGLALADAHAWLALHDRARLGRLRACLRRDHDVDGERG